MQAEDSDIPELSIQEKNPPVMQEMQEAQVQSLGQYDLLEEVITIHSSILNWNIPWTEELGRPGPIGSQRVRRDSSD